MLKNDKIFLLTNGTDYKMHNISGWARNDILKYCEFNKIECLFSGIGYATNQSIKEGTIINSESKLEVELTIKEFD
jgi:hypothetical protein